MAKSGTNPRSIQKTFQTRAGQHLVGHLLGHKLIRTPYQDNIRCQGTVRLQGTSHNHLLARPYTIIILTSIHNVQCLSRLLPFHNKIHYRAFLDDATGSHESSYTNMSTCLLYTSDAAD